MGEFIELYTCNNCSAPRPIPLPVTYHCYECGRSFRTKQALAVHAFNKHGQRRNIRRKVAGGMCCSCLMQFHTRIRLLNHLTEKSPICHEYYMSALPDLPEHELASLDEID